MNLIEKLFAAVMLVACLVLLARLFAGARRRDRFDAAWRRWRARLMRTRLPFRSARSATPEPAHQRAERMAQEAIERARRRADGGAWDGNVYRPGTFGKPRKNKKRDLH